MEIVTTVASLKEALKARRDNTGAVTTGFVPTMGALHDGHISLVRRARNENDIVTVSVFVNPTQFNNPDDLATYPRTIEADCQKLEAAGVDIVFAPTVEEMYPEGKDTRIFELGEVAEVMEGPMRPGHFNGVAQVVSKLFEMIKPDRAYFGEKDFQQIAVIRRMIKLIGHGPEIVPCEICRAPDGLALSSRNVRLNDYQRSIAPGIYRELKRSVGMAPAATVEEVKKSVIEAIEAIDPQMKVEYYEIVDPETMQPVNSWGKGAQGCITVYCGDVRLIDNIKYGPY